MASFVASIGLELWCQQAGIAFLFSPVLELSDSQWLNFHQAHGFYLVWHRQMTC